LSRQCEIDNIAVRLGQCRLRERVLTKCNEQWRKVHGKHGAQYYNNGNQEAPPLAMSQNGAVRGSGDEAFLKLKAFKRGHVQTQNWSSGGNPGEVGIYIQAIFATCSKLL